jgi:hypothetical protein
MITNLFVNSALSWFSFVVIGLVLTGFLSIITRRRLSRTVRIVTIIGMAAAVYGLTAIEHPLHLGEEIAWYQISPYREIVLFVFMVLGMLARVLSAAIEERRSQVRQGNAAPALRLDIWESAYPLLFSVMTFGALLTQVGESKLTVAVIVLAFQTGFFWQTIIKQPKTV